MSVIKTISTLPDTKRNFSNPINDWSLISGLWVHDKDFVFPTEADWLDFDYWIAQMKLGNLTPLHYIKEVDPADEKTIYLESEQDFSYKGRNGRYRQSYKYNFNLDMHQVVEALSGTDLYFVIWDKNWNIYGTSDDGINRRGFKSNRLVLEKILLATANTPAYSALDIEWYNSDELNVNGVVDRVTWNPEDVDREFISVTIEYADSQNLNFTAKYLSNDIDDIEGGDVTLTDNISGELSFALFNYLGGVYQLGTFTKIGVPTDLTNGTLQILSDLWLGCVKYRVSIVVTVTNNFVFEDGENFVFEDGNNFIFDN